MAHELNQPLTAISNYSLGAVSRMKDGGVSNDELLPALEKTAGQAQRAGNIIRRIREFVKRSEPRRRHTEVARIVEDAIGFADIEAAKKGIAIHTDVQAGLPPLDVDPILIEQLLLNLLKNAVDAMDQAARAQDRSGRSAAGRYGRVFGDRSRLGRFGTAAGESVPTVLQYQIGRDGNGPEHLPLDRRVSSRTSDRRRNPEGGAIFVFTLPLAASSEAREDVE